MRSSGRRINEFSKKSSKDNHFGKNPVNGGSPPKDKRDNIIKGEE